jgi:hypothetical protein
LHRKIKGVAMNIKERIELLVQLGEYFLKDDEALQEVKGKANYQNAWFSLEFIDLALKNIADNFLQRQLLEDWVKQYNIKDDPSPQKKVGVIMAGNIPLVGFHDLLCTFISGHKAVIKASSKDEVLIKHVVQKLTEWDAATSKYITLADNLKNCDAYIATGSNNSSRYFEYYFSKYPNIIRKNRTSVAVLKGDETAEELNLLSDDVLLYYGMGCRNVSKIFAPEGYDFVQLLDALKKYSRFADFHKYRNNYDYQLALLIMNGKFYMTNDVVVLTENESVFAPVSQLNYSYYDDPKALIQSLQNNSDVQCIVGKDFTPFGAAQTPSLTDYADGIDTMKFLASL